MATEGAGNLWQPLPLLIYGLLLLGLLLAFLILPSQARGVLGFESIGTATITLAGYIVGFLLMFTFLSGQFLRHWSLQLGGFSPVGGDFLLWTLYALSWLLDNGLGNFGQIFGWDISSIQPINDTSKALVWVYNRALEFLAVASVVRVVRVVRQYLRESPRQDASARVASAVFP
jgi:hypothetical protein